MRRVTRMSWLALLLSAGCAATCGEAQDHGPFAEAVTGPLGTIRSDATPAQREAFARGRTLSQRRYGLHDGLGPAYNVTFCGACHERPEPGGSSGLYRNFYLSGVITPSGAFLPGESVGSKGGVIRLYSHAPGQPARPPVPAETNVIAQRNAIPYFGVGLLAEVPESEILLRADPEDADHDGVSGRPNYDRGFVGRFGMKAQTVSIEGFIRGPLYNHVGITTDPLTEEQRARLPVDSSSRTTQGALEWLGNQLFRFGQAAAPDGPLVDDDGVPDPELSRDELFDLVSFAMLLAAPRPEALDASAKRGLQEFDRIGCGTCHTPRLNGPHGALPAYSDLLLHDMGPALADGIRQGEATGAEFRTQPLWGIAAEAPYLHDGRAATLEEAILWHGGEGQPARDRFAALGTAERADVVAFLRSLGGRTQESAGMLPPATPVPAAGEYGGPSRALDGPEMQAFADGRALFDRDFGLSEGLGAPRFNGDSCRACHFEPVVGGAGPRGVDVIRHGILNRAGEFVPPAVGTILHRLTKVNGSVNRPQIEANAFELRQTPPLFGLGLVEGIPDSAILAHADPDDADHDGISGRPSWADGGRLGRFGWKAQVPSLAEFVRDATANEMGLTLPREEGLTFGRMQDDDGVPDPELSLDEAQLLARYLELLGPPPRQPVDAAVAAKGESTFTFVGCATCHLPSLPGASGAVPLYSDLLLHEVLPPASPGIEETSADMREFRTAPLWGLAKTAPYLHSGDADTIDEAIRRHDGEAAGVRDAYVSLSESERESLLTFLGSL